MIFIRRKNIETLKDEALNAISKLPETADIDDIMYRLYVIDKEFGDPVPEPKEERLIFA